MVLEGLLEWSKTTLVPFGGPGLFLVAFIESSFFPIPPDIILIPLVLADPNMALVYALIATIGSVLGSLLGYFIGKKGGRPLLKKFVSKKHFKKVERYFEKYGIWAVGAAALTPIPYKIFTIASGVFKFSIKKMLAVSVIGRGTRFFAEAIVLMIWGEQIIDFFINSFEIATLLVVVIIVIVYVLYKKVISKKLEA